jgi:hypothetical protein
MSAFAAWNCARSVGNPGAAGRHNGLTAAKKDKRSRLCAAGRRSMGLHSRRNASGSRGEAH